MSNLDNTKLSRAGWIKFGSISGCRDRNGHIVLYDNPYRRGYMMDTVSQNMSLNRPRYCEITIDREHSDAIYNGPCLYMFVTYLEECLVQIEPRNFSRCINSCVVQIVEDSTDFSKLTYPSISKSVAVALELNQAPVYLYYWPLYGHEQEALACAEYKFLVDNNNNNPIWDD